ncbi:MAG: Glycerol-3-phosphate dehydrogenase (NAD(P)+) [Actinobacteria bacterium ADurb.Bin346]|nr:MAG: Glycerol-3-phosphate dehydrogenase (NAD(P)+) [Actinobacteria bacterium ADurb.Bin346]
MVNKVCVLGAGYMGGAITFPLSDNGIGVNLWGTWLDDDLISGSIGGFHPRLKKPLNKNVKFFYSSCLKDAISGVDTFFIAVTSEGFPGVFELLVDNLDFSKNYCFFKLTKGLVKYQGKIVRASEAAESIYKKHLKNLSGNIKGASEKNRIYKPAGFAMTSIGGPVRAVDLASRIPTVSVYGSNTKAAFDKIKYFTTDYYRIHRSSDPAGVEICSTFKNIYSIAAGLCDGIYGRNFKGSYYNIIALLFNQSVLEMLKIVEAAGGKKETAISFAGIGDLHVTSAAGRNRKYGELVGSGDDPAEAYCKMQREGEYGEGYVALKLSIPWLDKFGLDIEKELPLLSTLYRIIYKKNDIKKALNRLILKMGN